MIKILIFLVCISIFYFTFREIEKFQTLDEIYKLNKLIDLKDSSKKVNFVEYPLKESNAPQMVEQSYYKTSNNLKNNISYSGNSISYSDNISNISNIGKNIEKKEVIEPSPNEYIISFLNDSLKIEKGGIEVSKGNNFIIEITDSGYYKFLNNDNINISNKLLFIIQAPNVTIDGNNVVLNLMNKNNYEGIVENGTSNTIGYDNVIIKNLHLNYVNDFFVNVGSGNGLGFNEEQSENLLSNNSDEFDGGGGVCKKYFANGSKKNIISDCFVYKTKYFKYGGGIVGKYGGCNGGELLIMNCVVSGILKIEYFSNDNINTGGMGGICGAYLGNNEGNVLVYNCTNYSSILNEYCGGIVGPYTANFNSNILIFSCNNFGVFENYNNNGGIVGPYSVTNQSTLFVVCCFSYTFDKYPSESNFGGLIAINSVLFNSKIYLKMCYTNFKNTDSKSYYFMAPADVLNSDANNQHTPEQQQEHNKDENSKIYLDYCFNDNIPFQDDINSYLLSDQFFNLPNVFITNCGIIDFNDEQKNKFEGKFFSGSLKSYNISDLPSNKFPYNLLFGGHLDKENKLNNNPNSLFNDYNNGDFILNLYSYYDDRLMSEPCIYNFVAPGSEVKYYKLKYSVLSTPCSNNSNLISGEDLFELNKNYDNTFGNNVNYEKCKNKSLKNCNSDFCNFTAFYSQMRCFPKSNGDKQQKSYEQIEMLASQIECLNLSKSECIASKFCNFEDGNLGGGGLCLSK